MSGTACLPFILLEKHLGHLECLLFGDKAAELGVDDMQRTSITWRTSARVAQCTERG